MITDSEAQMAYKHLQNAAINHQLEWLVEDVKRQIALGKEVTREIHVEAIYRAEDPAGPRKRKGPPAKFVVSLPYSPQEKLLLLVEAIEAASVGLSLSMQKTWKTIVEKKQHIKSIGFADDAEGSEIDRLNASNIPDLDAVTKLQKLLVELKESL